jgi:hypothetical protein
MLTYHPGRRKALKSISFFIAERIVYETFRESRQKKRKIREVDYLVWKGQEP